MSPAAQKTGTALERSLNGPNQYEMQVSSIPSFKTKEQEREWAKQHMAAAFRVFGKRGYTEGTAGHISLRDPVRPDTFWINPYITPFSSMKVSDLVHIDEDGNMMDPESAAGKSVNAAGFLIHAAIHRARPDINAACHTHSPYGKAFSTFGEPIETLNQDACMFYERLAVYANFGGAVVTEEEGENIAKALGSDKTCAILQNHGLLTCGSTVDEAAYLHTCLENCCKVQLAVDAAMANPKYKKYFISHEEAVMTRSLVATKDYLYNHFQPDYQLLLEETNGAFLK